jgi:HK97 family phage major capsid protein
VAYNTLISRDVSDDPLIPTPISAAIIQEVATSSAVLQRARQVPMSTKTQSMPVVDVLPMAYFVTGDTGLKQTTTMDWKGIKLVAEEVAVIVPIPDAYLDDAQVPIWNEVRPRMVEAIGAVVDAACLFGVNKPSTWGTDIYSGVMAAGNTVIDGTSTNDFAQDVTALGELLAKEGSRITGFISRPGLGWRLTGLRSTQGVPIYQPNLAGGAVGSSLYGTPLSESTNGAFDATEVELFAGDWSKAIVGMRQDISWKLFTEGVISDADGKVLLNLMQQDSVALRVVMRMGWAVANPATRLAPTEASRFYFGAIQSTTAAS